MPGLRVGTPSQWLNNRHMIITRYRVSISCDSSINKQTPSAQTLKRNSNTQENSLDLPEEDNLAPNRLPSLVCSVAGFCSQKRLNSTQHSGTTNGPFRCGALCSRAPAWQYKKPKKEKYLHEAKKRFLDFGFGPSDVSGAHAPRLTIVKGCQTHELR